MEKRLVKVELPHLIAEKWLPEDCDDWDCQYIFHWKEDAEDPWYVECISDFDGYLWHEGLQCEVTESDDLFTEDMWHLIAMLDAIDDAHNI